MGFEPKNNDNFGQYFSFPNTPSTTQSCPPFQSIVLVPGYTLTSSFPPQLSHLACPNNSSALPAYLTTPTGHPFNIDSLPTYQKPLANLSKDDEEYEKHLKALNDHYRELVDRAFYSLDSMLFKCKWCSNVHPGWQNTPKLFDLKCEIRKADPQTVNRANVTEFMEKYVDIAREYHGVMEGKMGCPFEDAKAPWK